MGFVADVWAKLMWSLRTQTSVGGEWLGDQMRRLSSPEELVDTLASLDKWALELAPEKYLGRLTPMVEAWVRQAPKEEVAAAAGRIGDDAWLLDAMRQVLSRDPANGWLGVGLAMLQGAFRKAGLIRKAYWYDRFKFEVTVEWK